MPRHRWLLSLALCALPLHTAAANDAGDRHQQLLALFAEEWEFEARTQPEIATTDWGINRYNDQLSDYSAESLQAQYATRRTFAQRLGAIEPGGLSQEDQLNRELLQRRLELAMRSYELKLHEMPIEPLWGFHIQPVLWMKGSPFHRVKDYENYLARLTGLPRAFAQIVELARRGVRDKRVQPRYLLQKVVGQAAAMTVLGEKNPLAHPLSQFPATISEPERQRLRAAILRSIDKEVVPAYRDFARFVAEEYANQGRAEPGLWALPDGDTLYRFCVREHTTTELSPDEIHEIGKRSVTEIEEEMTALAKRQGYKDLAAYRAALKKNPQQYARSREQILEQYRLYIGKMAGQVATLFGTQPRAELVVEAVEPFREKESGQAMYYLGAADGSRKGRVVVNTRDHAQQPLFVIESTAYHEGIPGHHFQLSLAQEQKDVPAHRQYATYSAFMEGWALYAERLGKEVGLYQDPANDYGRLTNEMVRSVRLVLDTGVHSKHWSRQQMVDYFRQHTAMDESYIQAETDRYIGWPGQALAYKVGQLRLLALRRQAESKLGSKWNLRAFHDQLLGSGSMPLDLLEKKMLRWIESQGH